MSVHLAPDRISIKRRREEEPVDTLYLEHATAPDQKKRITEFYFKRVRDYVIAPVSQQPQPSHAPPVASSSSGIPTVRWTSPGDDVRDMARLKASMKERAALPENGDGGKRPVAGSSAPSGSMTSAKVVSPPPAEQAAQHRRFHLARHLFSTSSALHSAAPRTQNSSIRPPIATFIERQIPNSVSGTNGTAVDRVVHVPQEDPQVSSPLESQPPDLNTLQVSKRSALNTFVTARKPSERTGTSIRDNPNTWDHDSDQLANELAALAMELDPEMAALQPPMPAIKSESETTNSRDHNRMDLDGDDDYVFETYIRVLQTEDGIAMDLPDLAEANFGVLVIDQEDEELWNKYVDSDQEDDWDEEDSNAEDNPSNDYPEDEVSSDDEYGYNPYHKYRDHASDDDYDDNATGTW
ncbi:hypothetical protein PV10_08757 [Exophiala mesophila]|uniref:Transcription factor Iwr1 domain-containing protein n=1 Tax=Exophiala mesophila TaxID=212818 RepID=A0A0D1XLW7_EXOME|nr:uncharacterized protein PV10_08757 [Exophiala mesophila]KIV89166.1 hypothetical protein PV10_08757 [Exophiala mesophila]